MITFTLTCLALITLPKLDVIKLSKEKIDLYFSILCYSIIILFFCTAVLRRDVLAKRAYLEGYIIPHAFAYYMAIFGYYFLMRRKFLLAGIPLIAGCIVGTRTGVMLILLAILSFLLIELKSLKFATIIKISIIGGILIIALFIFSGKARSQLNSVFNSFKGFSYSVEKGDKTSKSYSSNRSLLMAIGIDQIRKDGISISNILGRGPRSSYEFIRKSLTWKIWFHNDFMEIAFSLGIINLIIYLYAIFYYCKKMKSLFFFLFLLIAAFTNGFYFYSSFTLIGVHYLTEITKEKKLVISS
jgi:hypothetical protein